MVAAASGVTWLDLTWLIPQLRDINSLEDGPLLFSPSFLFCTEPSCFASSLIACMVVALIAWWFILHILMPGEEWAHRDGRECVSEGGWTSGKALVVMKSFLSHWWLPKHSMFLGSSLKSHFQIKLEVGEEKRTSMFSPEVNDIHSPTSEFFL